MIQWPTVLHFWAIESLEIRPLHASSRKRCFCFSYRCSWVGFSERLQMLEFHPDLLKVAKHNKQNMQPNGDLQYWSFNTVESAQTQINEWAANKCFVFTPHTCTIILYVHHSYMILWWCSMIPPQPQIKVTLLTTRCRGATVQRMYIKVKHGNLQGCNKSHPFSQWLMVCRSFFSLLDAQQKWSTRRVLAPQKGKCRFFLLDNLPSETLKKQHQKDTETW